MPHNATPTPLRPLTCSASDCSNVGTTMESGGDIAPGHWCRKQCFWRIRARNQAGLTACNRCGRTTKPEQPICRRCTHRPPTLGYGACAAPDCMNLGTRRRARGRDWCSPTCDLRIAWRERRWGHAGELQHKRATCRGCGEPFTPTAHQSIYCSQRCASRVHGRTYRHRRYGGLTDDYSIADIAARDGWGCHLCGRPTHRDDHRDGGYATIDHVIPVSRFGPDILANVRIACFACNMSRGATLLGCDQLQLFAVA